MQTYEHNHRDFQQGSASEADKTLLVKFFLEPRLDKQESEKQKRPIYKDVEHIDIKIPGNRCAGACRPATDADKKRFAEHYQRFKDRVEDIDTGTPLNEWPAISRSQAEELAFFHVKTVEQLANMSDTQTSQFMGLVTLREQAKLWLEKAKEDSKFFEVSSELKNMSEQNAVLKEQLGEMFKEINQLKSLTAKSEKNKPRSKK